MLVFVSGGVRSGKSTFAEKRVSDHAALRTDSRKIYLATAQPIDDEMSARIARHRQARDGAGWSTFEVPFGPAAVLERLHPGDSVLLDCATVWLSNRMFGMPPERVEAMRPATTPLSPTPPSPTLASTDPCVNETDSDSPSGIVTGMLAEACQAASRVSMLTIVSNDVFSGLYETYAPETRRFISLLGEFHCRLAAVADEAWECISGIPIQRKPMGGSR